MNARKSLIGELESAIQSGSRERRVDTLRRVTDLFLIDCDRLSEDQVGVFDEVLTQLVTRIETKARVELGERLAPVENAPIETIRRLAGDDEIAVAAPVLSQSQRLTSNDLIEIARTKSQDHLLAISCRSKIEEQVTDALLERGNDAVYLRLASNNGASFSESGYSRLVHRADGKDSLAEKLALRLDIPIRFFRELIARATEAVRAKLIANASPEYSERVKKILSEIAGEVGKELPGERDFAAAELLVGSLRQQGELNEVVLLEFVVGKRYEESMVALATLCGAPVKHVEGMIGSGRSEALIVACKSAGVGWPVLRAMLKSGFFGKSHSEDDVESARQEYYRLSVQTAQRVMRFWQVRQSTGGSAPA